MPSCAITSAQKSSRLVAMAITTAGLDAITIAVAAVIARPAHIQP